jgi:hypothetical protein
MSLSAAFVRETEELVAEAESRGWFIERGRSNPRRPWATPWRAQRGRRTLYDSDLARLLKRIREGEELHAR